MTDSSQSENNETDATISADDTNDDNYSENLGRKRIKDESKWKANVRKKTKTK